jgi:AhpD family alkylhydroperoxidase
MRIAPASTRPWYLRPFFWNQRRKYGRALDAALLWARSPRLFLAVATLYGALDRRSSPIQAPLRSLLTVRVSQLNHCRFCVDINAATALKRGVGEDKLWALEDWRASNLFDARERIALEYAEAMTRSDLEVSDDLMARLRRLFDDDAIVELTALIAFQNLSSRFNAALDVPPQGFCRLPERVASARRVRASARRAQRPGFEQGGEHDP